MVDSEARARLSIDNARPPSVLSGERIVTLDDMMSSSIAPPRYGLLSARLDNQSPLHAALLERASFTASPASALPSNMWNVLLTDTLESADGASIFSALASPVGADLPDKHPARVAAATASTPARTRASKGARKSLALAGSCSRA